MSNKVCLILGIMFIVFSLIYFFEIENPKMGVMELCAGVLLVITALVRYNKDKINKD